MRGELIGYARVSSHEQDLTIQLEQLQAAGCHKIFSEKKSATSTQGRVELERCLAYVREGDTLIVTRIDRFARSVADFAKIVDMLQAKGVEMRCLLQPFDTASPSGRLMRDILAAFAEFETAVRRERQREGIAKAKAAGKYQKTGSWQKKGGAIQRLTAGQTYDQVSEAMGVSKRTLRRWYPLSKVKAHRLALKSTASPSALNPEPRSLPPSVGEPIAAERTPETAAPRRGIFGRLIRD